MDVLFVILAGLCVVTQLSARYYRPDIKKVRFLGIGLSFNLISCLLYTFLHFVRVNLVVSVSDALFTTLCNIGSILCVSMLVLPTLTVVRLRFKDADRGDRR